MKKKISFLQAFTQQYYHSVPSDLQMMTLSPERDAIFNYLSRIGHNRFPEFILDILVHVKGHNPIDITDGPGDEKQDILTEDETGRRHLTQCKHTSNYNDHYSGNELDFLFGACFRKNCTKGLFVTNSDLTPQAKRYITDKEYARGWTGPHNSLPVLSYWNGAKIWELIAKNSAILNKWFSGMGQTHGLRRFSFDLIIQHLPSGKPPRAKCPDIVDSIKNKSNIREIEQSHSYEVSLNETFRFIISDWFHNDLDLGVPYVMPVTEYELVNIPLWALKVQVEISNDVERYNPASYRDLIVKFLGENALDTLPASEWWYLVATPPQAFLFLQDIVEPKVISVTSAESYVKVGSDTVNTEKDWVFLNDDKSLVRIEDDDKSLQWRDVQSEIDIFLMFEQRPHPISDYQHHIRQHQIVNKIRNYKFRIVENASIEVIEKVRRIVDPRWVVMQMDGKHVLWALPPNEKTKKIQEIENALKRQKINILYIKDEIGTICCVPQIAHLRPPHGHSLAPNPIWLLQFGWIKEYLSYLNQ